MITFFLQGLRHLFQVGTVVPSSPWLARAMALSVEGVSSRKRVLEIGPGTGAITRMILPSLQDGDELHLVEINPSFCRHIEARILRRYRPANPGVRIDLSCDSILSAQLSGRFDFVICSLPFRAFSAAEVRLVFDRLVDLVADAGVLTYMEYVGARMVKSPFVRRSRRWELRRIDQICQTLNGQLQASRELVLLNTPPTFVVRLTKNVDVTAMTDDSWKPLSCTLNGTSRSCAALPPSAPGDRDEVESEVTVVRQVEE